MSKQTGQKQIEEDFYLTSAHREKELISGEKFAFGGMQGWRATNEDFHKHLLPIDNHSWKLWSYFSIFDGHHGIDTAKNASDLLDKHLIDALNNLINNSKNDIIHSSHIDINQLKQVIKHTFFQLDKQLAALVNDSSGSVCIVCLLGPENIYLINLGDSRGIIISDDGQVLASTKDHRASVAKEKERICRAGGQVTQYGDDVPRVQSLLAVSRALGDYYLDKHLIPASPDIIAFSKRPSATFIILACDGIWDVMTNEQVALFVSQRVSNTPLEDIVSQLLDHCLNLESTDNMSIYIITI